MTVLIFSQLVCSGLEDKSIVASQLNTKLRKIFYDHQVHIKKELIKFLKLSL
jgi:hypothetical protein